MATPVVPPVYWKRAISSGVISDLGAEEAEVSEVLEVPEAPEVPEVPEVPDVSKVPEERFSLIGAAACRLELLVVKRELKSRSPD